MPGASHQLFKFQVSSFINSFNRSNRYFRCIFKYTFFVEQDSEQKSALDLKSEGNAHFKEEKYELAVACYTQALKLLPKDEKDKEKLKDRGVILKNRAACYLKLVSNIIVGTLLIWLPADHKNLTILTGWHH